MYSLGIASLIDGHCSQLNVLIKHIVQKHALKDLVTCSNNQLISIYFIRNKNYQLSKLVSSIDNICHKIGVLFL